MNIFIHHEYIYTARPSASVPTTGSDAVVALIMQSDWYCTRGVRGSGSARLNLSVSEPDSHVLKQSTGCSTSYWI